MPFPPSSASKHKSQVKAVRSKKVYNMCSNAIFLEAAVAFHSPEPFHADLVLAATEFNRILQCINGNEAELFGDLHGNVHETTVSTLLTSVLAKRLSCSPARGAREILGSLATCPLPDDLNADLRWSCEAPLVLESTSQGRMDVLLALRFDSGFRGNAGARGSLPVAFIELTKNALKLKKYQMLCNSIGCMQAMRQSVSVYPLLGVALNADKMQCVAFCPELGGKVGKVPLCKVDVSVDSVCRLLRMMLFWSVAVQPFISVTNSLSVQFDRDVVISGAFCWSDSMPMRLLMSAIDIVFFVNIVDTHPILV